MAYPHVVPRTVHNVAYLDVKRDVWYFNGEYQNLADAAVCARKTANSMRTKARVTTIPHDGPISVAYYEPEV